MRIYVPEALAWNLLTSILKFACNGFSAFRLDGWFSSDTSGTVEPSPWRLKSSMVRLFRRASNAKVKTLLNSGLFDVVYYSRMTSRDFAKASDAARHFLSASRSESADPHPLFSVSWYVAQIPDLPQDVNALLHYLATGAADLRQPHPLFDPGWYLWANSLQDQARSDPLGYYVRKGWTLDHKVHPLFDSAWYKETYPDVARAGIDAFKHFVAYGAGEKRSPSPFFDTAWYLRRYPDVESSGANALAHYLFNGAREGRDPSASFDTSWYLKAYRDIAAAGLNPLVHFAEHGRVEGRRGTPKKEYRLRPDFGLQKEEFVNWRELALRPGGQPESIYDSWRQLALSDFSGSTVPEAIGSPLIVVLKDEGKGSESSLLQHSAKRASDALHLDCRIVRERLDDPVLSDIEPYAVVLFIQQADRVDASGLAALMRQAASVKLCVFDMYYFKDDIAYPVLQPGPNRAHVRAIDSTFSRFAIRGDLLRTVLVQTEATDSRSILLESLAYLSASRDWGAFGHCALPVLQTPDLTQIVSTLRIEKLAQPRLASHTQTTTVSVVICTKDKGHLLSQLLRQLCAEESIVDIVVVANQTTNMYAKHALRFWGENSKVKVIDYDKPFNFSDQCNVGVRVATGDLLLFLNDDIVPVSPDWLQQLIEPFSDPIVGMTGPLLLYPNESLQHAALFLGFNNTAGHTLRGAKLPEEDYVFTATAERNVSCVTGAALLMRRSCFDDMNGFDPHLVTILQDVDLCLRTINSGYEIIFVPGSILLHMESVSIKEMFSRPKVHEHRELEHEYFYARHGRQGKGSDRYLNPNHDVSDETLHHLTY